MTVAPSSPTRNVPSAAASGWRSPAGSVASSLLRRSSAAQSYAPSCAAETESVHDGDGVAAVITIRQNVIQGVTWTVLHGYTRCRERSLRFAAPCSTDARDHRSGRAEHAAFHVSPIHAAPSCLAVNLARPELARLLIRDRAGPDVPGWSPPACCAASPARSWSSEPRGVRFNTGTSSLLVSSPPRFGQSASRTRDCRGAGHRHDRRAGRIVTRR